MRPHVLIDVQETSANSDASTSFVHPDDRQALAPFLHTSLRTSRHTFLRPDDWQADSRMLPKDFWRASDGRKGAVSKEAAWASAGGHLAKPAMRARLEALGHYFAEEQRAD